MNPKLFVLGKLFLNQFKEFPGCGSCVEIVEGPPVCYNVKGNENSPVEVTGEFCCENWAYWLMPVAERVINYEDYIKLLLGKT